MLRIGLAGLAHRYADAYDRAFSEVNLYEPAEWRRIMIDSRQGVVELCRHGDSQLFHNHDALLPIYDPGMVVDKVAGRLGRGAELRRAFWAPLCSSPLGTHCRTGADDAYSLPMVAEPAPCQQ